MTGEIKDLKGHVAAFLIVLTLAIGLSAGFVIRDVLPPDQPSAPVFNVISDDSDEGPSNESNPTLVMSAYRVLEAIRDEDFSALSNYVDSDEGVTVTPFSTVNFSSDVRLSLQEISGAGDSNIDYIWGMTPSEGEPIRMTIQEFFSSFLWDADYTLAAEIGIDTVCYVGNAQENVADAYPDDRFVDFYLAGEGADNMNWSSLKLVFSQKAGQWRLVGIVHSKWMP